MASRKTLKGARFRALVWTYPLWSKLYPSGHRRYHAPYGHIYLDVTESEMMLWRAFGRFERSKQAALKHLLNPGDVFVDVGANKGDFSLLASGLVGKEGKVIAVEPEPENCKWIQQSLESNGCRNVRLVQAALSDRDGTATLHLGKKSGWHSLATDARSSGDRLNVKTITMDTLLAEHTDGRADVIKIDVEGAEAQVINGAMATLSRGINALLLDVHPALGVDPIAICDALAPYQLQPNHEARPFNRPLSPDANTRAILFRQAPQLYRR